MIVLMTMAALVSVGSEARPVSKGLEIPNAIVRQHDAYVLCQDAHFDIGRVHDGRTFIAEAEKAIAACKDQKASLMQQVEVILARAPDYTDPAKRQRAVCEAFTGYDEMRRAMARSSPTFEEKCR